MEDFKSVLIDKKQSEESLDQRLENCENLIRSLMEDNKVLAQKLDLVLNAIK